MTRCDECGSWEAECMSDEPTLLGRAHEHDARASRDAAHANIEKLHIALSAMRDLLEDAASVIDGMNGRCQTTTEWISRADAIESSVSASPKKE